MSLFGRKRNTDLPSSYEEMLNAIRKEKAELDKEKENQESYRAAVYNHFQSRSWMERDIHELKVKKERLQLEVGLFDSIQKMREEIAQLGAKKAEMERGLIQTQEECSFLRGVVLEFAKNKQP